jgi:hypothetical protein
VIRNQKKARIWFEIISLEESKKGDKTPLVLDIERRLFEKKRAKENNSKKKKDGRPKEFKEYKDKGKEYREYKPKEQKEYKEKPLIITPKDSGREKEYKEYKDNKPANKPDKNSKYVKQYVVVWKNIKK